MVEVTNTDGGVQAGPREAEPLELARRLRGLAGAAGATIPDDLVLEAPRVFVGNNQPVQRVVSDMAGLLRDQKFGLYRLGNMFGTIHPHVKTGYEWRPMTAERLATWLPNDCQILPYRGHDKNDKLIIGEFSDTVCKKLLSGDDLWRSAPMVQAIHTVRMPIFRKELDERGKRKVELLPYGYDEESRVYTLSGAAFPDDMEVKEAGAWIRSLLKYFEFEDERSRAIQVAAMLTAFCKLMFAGKSPMFCWNANLAGSGKSALAQLALIPVFRTAPMSGYSKENTIEVRKELDAVAQEGRSVVFFDNMPPGYIANADLDRWLLSNTWQCRVLGQGRTWQGPLSALTYMTGNDLRLSDDLGRRSLMVDLFAHFRPKDRVLPEDAVLLDEEFFSNPEMLGKTLGALYSIVRYWDQELGRPGASGKALASFTGWSRVIPPIVEAAGWGDCLAIQTSRHSGNTEGLEYELLVAAVIEDCAKGRDRAEVTLKDVVGVTRRAGLFVEMLGTVEDVLESEGIRGGFNPKKLSYETETERRDAAAQFLNASQNSSWGKRFRKHVANGRHFFSKTGDVWQLGDRTSCGGTATFVLAKVRERELASVP